MSFDHTRYKGYINVLMIMFVGIAIWSYKLGFSSPRFGEPFDTVVVSLTSVFSFDLVVRLITAYANRSDFIKRLYWGREYLDGIWLYTSKNEEGQSNLGIWKIEQDLETTRFTAFRCGKNFEKLTTVRSISKFEERDGLVEVVGKRTDWDFSRKEYYSKSVLSLDNPVKRSIFMYTVTMRGETVIYGGEKNGLLSSNVVWEKLECCKTEAQAVEALKKKFYFDEADNTWKRH